MPVTSLEPSQSCENSGQMDDLAGRPDDGILVGRARPATLGNSPASRLKLHHSGSIVWGAGSGRPTGPSYPFLAKPLSNMSFPFIRTCLPLLLALVGSMPLSAEPLSRLLKLEAAMWKLVNNDRAEHDRPPLELDPDLSAVARAHSRDMAKNGFFGHQSPKTGEIGDRYFAAGIAAARMSENVAMHGTIEGAQEGLMKSPGHRKNLLDPEVSQVGIGIHRDRDGQLYITQNFAKPMPVIDLDKAPDEFLGKLNQLREEQNLKALNLDPKLQEICQANSERMHELGRIDGKVAEKQLRKIKRTMKRYMMFYHFCLDLDAILAHEKLLERDLTDIGIGIVRNQKKEGGFGMLWVTVVAAEKR